MQPWYTGNSYIFSQPLVQKSAVSEKLFLFFIFRLVSAVVEGENRWRWTARYDTVLVNSQPSAQSPPFLLMWCSNIPMWCISSCTQHKWLWTDLRWLIGKFGESAEAAFNYSPLQGEIEQELRAFLIIIFFLLSGPVYGGEEEMTVTCTAALQANLRDSVPSSVSLFYFH